MHSSPSRTSVSIERLRADLTGRVIAPGDSDYDEARDRRRRRRRSPTRGDRPRRRTRTTWRTWSTLARETGLELAVRSGGHSTAGHGVSEGGIVLDLRDMKAHRDRRRPVAPPGRRPG